MRRIFGCIDNVTKKEMVLSDVSFNNACFFVDSEARKHKIDIISINMINDIAVIKLSNGIHFYYDENRGVLLKD